MGGSQGTLGIYGANHLAGGECCLCHPNALGGCKIGLRREDWYKPTRLGGGASPLRGVGSWPFIGVRGRDGFFLGSPLTPHRPANQGWQGSGLLKKPPLYICL